MGVLTGYAAGKDTDSIIKLFLEGAKDILSAAIVVGLAGGIIQILQDGRIIDPILHALASLMNEAGRVASVGAMYVIQTLINIIIPLGIARIPYEVWVKWFAKILLLFVVLGFLLLIPTVVMQLPGF